MSLRRRLHPLLGLLALLTACATPQAAPTPTPASPLNPVFPTPAAEFTPMPTRLPYQPGELVDYIVQTGDTLPALAARFNTSVAEIRAANPIIPENASSLPPGLPPLPAGDHPLLRLPQVIVTPHTGAHTDDAVNAMGRMALAACLAVLRGERPTHVVNPAVYEGRDQP